MLLRTVSCVVLLLLAGCATAPLDDAEVDDPIQRLAAATYDSGTVHVPVKVPVVLIGFDDGVAKSLADALENRTIEHQIYTYARSLLAPSGSAPSPASHHVVPKAMYSVHALEAGTLRDDLEATAEDGYFNALQAEEAILNMLAANDLAADAAAPTLVFLHLGEQGHAYRLHYPTGYIQGVRVFGERHPVLVMDTSAALDPWVGGWNAYNQPMGSDGDIEALVAATEAATNFRLLQAPIYPPSIKPCHAVTLITATRGTALATHLPGYADPEDLVDVANLTVAWEQLLGEGRVHVDAVFLDLPQDDPALEVILRNGPSDALRYWMDENWDDYWVAHDGCEAYVSLFLIGDATDSGVSGIAMYDVRDDRRLSWSAMNDMTRFQEESDGAFAPIFGVDDDSRDHIDWLNFLYTHETGHLFGQRHPHDYSSASGGGFDRTFSSVWSSMSYQQDGKIPLFGVVDANNQARNRAGFLVEAAMEQGVNETIVDQALEHMGNLEWWDAAYVLEPELAAVHGHAD